MLHIACMTQLLTERFCSPLDGIIKVHGGRGAKLSNLQCCVSWVFAHKIDNCLLE